MRMAMASVVFDALRNLRDEEIIIQIVISPVSRPATNWNCTQQLVFQGVINLYSAEICVNHGDQRGFFNLKSA